MTVPTYEPFNDVQQRQLTILGARNFNLTIVWRDEDKHQVVVAGRDPADARLIGKIDSRGVFVADLMDYPGSTVGVAAPPAGPTVTELMA